MLLLAEQYTSQSSRNSILVSKHLFGSPAFLLVEQKRLLPIKDTVSFKRLPVYERFFWMPVSNVEPSFFLAEQRGYD
jgi:hypothetical protein